MRTRAPDRATPEPVRDTIATTRAGVLLLPMHRENLAAVLELMRSNAAHFSQHSDFGELAHQTPETYSIALTSASTHGSQQYAFRIVEDGVLIGGIALVPVPIPQDPQQYSICYWLAADACRRGNATLALQTIATYAREHLGATDLSARVRPGNAASTAVLQRAGFQQVETATTVYRFHRPL